MTTFDDVYELMMDDDWDGPFDAICPECGQPALTYIGDDGEEEVLCSTDGGCVNSYDDPRNYSGF